MGTVTIPLSDEQLSQLRVWAEQAGLTPEEFLRRRVERMLDRPDEPFRDAAGYALEKNAELYRRLISADELRALAKRYPAPPEWLEGDEILPAESAE